MQPRHRRLPVVGGVLGALVLLLVLGLLSGTAAAAMPSTTASSQATQQTVTYSHTWHGTTVHRPARDPDVLVLPSPPAGVWWQISEIQLTGHFTVAKPFEQSSFLFSRTVQNAQAYPHLADPNLDSLAHIDIQAGKTGTKIGAGGVGSSPNQNWNWIRFTQPIRLNSEIQIVLGSSVGVGNYVVVQVQYEVLGSGKTIVVYAHPKLDGQTETFKVQAPSGAKWYLMNAFAEIQSHGGSHSVTMRTSSGTLLLSGSDFPSGVLVRCTGGYSTVQTGPALNRYGSQVVWQSAITLSGSEYITVQFTGASANEPMYVLVFTQE